MSTTVLSTNVFLSFLISFIPHCASNRANDGGAESESTLTLNTKTDYCLNGGRLEKGETWRAGQPCAPVDQVQQAAGLTNVTLALGA